MGDYFSPGKGYQDLGGHIQKGMDIAKQYEQQGEQAFSPYMGHQKEIFDQYRNAIGEGADPAALYNHYISQYQESPGYKQRLQDAQQGASRAAAASGMTGSGAEIQQAAERASNMRAQDQQDFLKHVLGLRGQYLSGLGGLEGQQFGMSQDLARMRAELGRQLMGGEEGIGKAQLGGDIATRNFLNQLLGEGEQMGGAATKGFMMGAGML